MPAILDHRSPRHLERQQAKHKEHEKASHGRHSNCYGLTLSMMMKSVPFRLHRCLRKSWPPCDWNCLDDIADVNPPRLGLACASGTPDNSHQFVHLVILADLAIARMDRPAASPLEIDSLSATVKHHRARLRSAGVIPPHKEITPCMEPACLPRARPISLSD